MLAAGGWLAHLPEPHAELLETDSGTVIKLLSMNILIQNNCSFIYMNIICGNYDFFLNSFHVMWPTDF